MRVFAGAQAQREGARGFQSGFTITLGQRQQPQAGTVGMLRMRLVLQHLFYCGCTGHADTCTPGHKPLGCPLRLMLVALGQVLDYRGESSLLGTAHVAGNALATVEYFHRMLCHPQLQRNTHQSVGHAVAVAFEFDMAVDMHAHRFEHRPLPGLHGQGHQGGSVDLGKHTGAAARQLLKFALVKPLQQGRYCRVDLGHAGKAQFAQPRQYPALYQLHIELDFGFLVSQQLQAIASVERS